MIHFTEKLKGTEKVAMQVLHVVMTYDCKENTRNEIKSKKNTHNYIIVYPKILGGQNTLSAHPMSWLGGRLPTLPPRFHFPRPWIRLRLLTNITPNYNSYDNSEFLKTDLFVCLTIYLSVCMFFSLFVLWSTLLAFIDSCFRQPVINSPTYKNAMYSVH